MRPQLTQCLLALLVSELDHCSETTDVILGRAGLKPWEIATLTGRPVSATPKPLPFWATQLAKRSPAR